MMDREETTRACGLALEDPAAQVRELNDRLRCHGRGGTMAVTAGVIALGHNALPAILTAMRQFTAFSADNDPHDEHDFGSIDWRGTKLFWKINSYDRDLRFGSPDPADPDVTTRVLTIMLAEEW